MSLTRSLTRPLTRKISRADLTQGFGGSFSPFALNPYLLFDARDSMVGTLENPTLDLNPALPETLDVITATRAGVATYTDADGNIATASADTVRVDYTQGAELTPTKFQHVVQTDYSASPNTIGPRVTLSDISGPDGESGGVRVTETANNTQHYLAVKNKEIVSGTTYTVSFYVKEGAYSSVVFYTESSKMESNVSMNFSTGNATFGGPDLVSNSGSFTSVGDGWYRVVYSATAQSSGEMDLYVSPKDLSSYAGDVNNFTDYYGFQVEEGTTASDFVANTTGSPKFITGATYGPRVPMILVEPSATNFLPYSEDFSHPGWTKVYNVVVTPSSVASPDGTTNAFKLSELQLSDGDYGLSEFLTTTPSTSYTFSAYFKATSDSDVGKKVRIRIRRNAGTSISASEAVTLTSEWVRHSVTIDLLSDNTSCWFVVAKDTSSATAEQAEECLIWGAQVETGSVATSYIPTLSGSTVTRAADDLVISGSDFDFYNQSEGTVYVELTSEDDGRNSYPVYFTQDIAGYAQRNNGTWAIQKDGTPNFYLASWANGGFVSDSLITLGSYTAGDLTRVSVSYDSNSYEGSKDGASVQTSTPTTMATTLVDRLFVGGSGIFQNSSRIKRLIYWPYHSDSL